MADDPEITAMQAIAAALQGLDADAVARVLRWASDRHGVPIKPPAMSKDRSTPDTPPGQYEHFADLYDAAGPTNDAERMLVAGYWFQVLQGKAELDSQTLTTELRHAGHPIDHAPHAVDTLVESRPSLMVQLKKEGSARQSRKKFKLTSAGIKRVKEMVAAQN